MEKIKFPKHEFSVFVAVGYQKLNIVRSELLIELKNKGYHVVSDIHPSANLPIDLTYRENCFIMNNVSIQPCVSIGSNNFIWSGCIIGHHSNIGNNNWLTSDAKFSGNLTLSRGEFNSSLLYRKFIFTKILQ